MPNSKLTDRPLIVISLEGFATSALGCYGSSWNRTPAIDTIASTGCVWDRWIATEDQPASLLLETIKATENDNIEKPWWVGWGDMGSIELFTDLASLGEQAETCFDRIESIKLPQPQTDDLPVEDFVDSQLGQLIAAAIERDSKPEPWGVLWLHSSYLTQRWDAPRDLLPCDEPGEESDDLNDSYADTDTDADIKRDPLPPLFSSVIPPCFQLADGDHPDLVASWMRTYGCQIRLLDTLIEVLLDSLRETDPYVLLTGTSGFRLGQGGWIGHRAGPLRSPDIRMPLIVSDCGPLRIPEVVSSRDLGTLLADMAMQEDRNLVNPTRWAKQESNTRVETRSDRADFALTTDAWYLVRDTDASEHLYLKPDDVEDFNDVGSLRGDVVDQLSETKK